MTGAAERAAFAYYDGMAEYYDDIMTSGYYDYKVIYDQISHYLPCDKLLEVGCGTGLILREIAMNGAIPAIAGFDLTESMLSVARRRLRGFPNVSLYLQNAIDLSLPEREYDLAFSYGGVWHFAGAPGDEPLLVSHLRGDVDNERALLRLARHMRTNGRLLIGMQGPHHDYERRIDNGMTYSQKITRESDGFVKNYFLVDGTRTMMEQTVNFRTYDFADAIALLAASGFQYHDAAADRGDGLFLEFRLNSDQGLSALRPDICG